MPKKFVLYAENLEREIKLETDYVVEVRANSLPMELKVRIIDFEENTRTLIVSGDGVDGGEALKRFGHDGRLAEDDITYIHVTAF